MLYGLYSMLGMVVQGLLVPLTPVLDRLNPGWRIGERLGRYDRRGQGTGDRLIWIHAASVGEIQAARVLIQGLRSGDRSCSFFLTTMTVQGRDFAASILPAHVRCELAPLDTPPAVSRSLQSVLPDLYICLETELWPVMLTSLHRAGVAMLLLNGRMSARSCSRYRRIGTTMSRVLSGFAALGVISEQDAACYRALGVGEEKIRICGNMKYDLQTDEVEKEQRRYRKLLQAGSGKVFICGSTRTGEEELLLPVYNRLRAATDTDLLWVIAPRHLERLGQVQSLLDRAGLGYELFSHCLQGAARNENIVLVDTMGDLAGLYAAGDFNFCGGSLVDRGGHNIMEPVLRRQPVYFGPHMADFQDAVREVLAAGAGFQVRNAGELATLLGAHLQGSGEFSRARQAAARFAANRHSGLRCQLDLVEEQLARLEQ